MLTKCLAKHAVFTAKREAEKGRLSDVAKGKEDVFHIAKQIMRENQDIVGDSCVKDNHGNLSLGDDAKKMHGTSA